MKDHVQHFSKPATADLFGGTASNFQDFEPLDFLAELTQHIPHEGAHLIRYYGYYSNNRRGICAKADSIVERSMIIDVHTHLSTLEQWGPVFCEACGRANAAMQCDLHVTPERHWTAMPNVDKAIVFGINSLALQMNTPNDAIADYARAHRDKIIGFMSIDPHQPDAIDEMERCVGDLGLRGIKMSPVYQHYHPCEEPARRVHRHAQRLGLPILTHAAFHAIADTPMQWANPLHYDLVAREFPDLTIILTHMGLPWFDDAMVVVRKHANVYADVSPAFHRDWLYQALLRFQEFDVMDKLLFGSDFPISTFEKTCQSLRNVNQVVAGTGLTTISEQAIEQIIDRDSLRLLGLD
ncbi:MAG: amidohydrolase family protein [Phycisphaeraceae bacterium]|nr:amidohydrolase family protein [Phycisphaeraceae bacterium]